MKKLSLIILILTISFIKTACAQNDQNKFNIIAYGNIGYGIIENDNQPNYNLNSNSGDILLNYNISENFGIASGAGFNQLSGNGFNENGNFYHERTVIKIPVLGTFDYGISDKLKLIGNFGPYAQVITSDEYRFLNQKESDVYSGWNFGFQMGLGFVYEIKNGFNAGFNFSGQSDLSKFTTESTAGFSDKQLLNNLTSLGIILSIEL